MKKGILVSGILAAGLMIDSFAMATPYGVSQGSPHGGAQHATEIAERPGGEIVSC